LKSKQVLKFKDTDIGKIPVEWEVKTLGEITDVTKLAGFEFTKFIKYTEEGEIIAIRSLNVKDGFLDLTNIKKIPKKISDALPRSKLFLNDVLLTYTGSLLGDVALIDKNDTYHLAPNVCRLRVKENCIPLFLAYYLRSSIFQNLLHSYTVGSGQPTIPMKNIRIIKIPNPKISEQEKIITIFSNLDSKIQNLQNQNIILEHTAQTIFKSWFVDFDGVTEFKDSKLGQIPKKWNVSNLGSKLITKSGGTPSRNVDFYWINGTINWINSGKVRDFRIINPVEMITKEAMDNSSTKFIPKKTTVIAITGATLGQVSFTEIDSCISQNVVGILETKDLSSEFIYFWIKHIMNILMSSQTGGAQQHINKKIVDDSLLMIPDKQITEKFTNVVKPSFEKIASNCLEIINVNKIFYNILPKLMSGEIQV